MLWINLIMDTFGAMALASLPPSKDVMKDKPRKRGSEHVNKIGNWAYFKEQWKLGAFIINKPMLGEILSVGIFFFVLLFAFLLIFQHADINSMTDFFEYSFLRQWRSFSLRTNVAILNLCMDSLLLSV